MNYTYSNKNYEDLNDSISDYQYYKPHIAYEQLNFNVSSNSYSAGDLYEYRHQNLLNQKKKKKEKENNKRDDRSIKFNIRK